MFNIKSKAALAALLLGTSTLVVGCASSQPNFADEVSDVAKEWRRGEKKVEEGRDLVADGERLVRKGRQQQAEGGAELKKAQTSVVSARERYDLALLELGGAKDADEATDEAKRLRELEKALRKAEDNVKDAQGKVKRGKDNVADGEKKLAKGKRLISEGEAEMADVEREYRQLSSLLVQ